MLPTKEQPAPVKMDVADCQKVGGWTCPSRAT